MFVSGCQDQSSHVAAAAMTATAKYISALTQDPIVMEMKPVLTPMITVLNACVQNGDADTVLEGLEVFEECSNMEFPLINDHVEVSMIHNP